MKRLLLIDAYAMIFRAYYAFIKQPRVTSKGENTSAIYGFLLTLDELQRKLMPTHIAVAFDPKGKTFRHEAYEQYKAQRQATPEDIHNAVPWIKSILEALNITYLEAEGYEADDVIGTVALKAGNEGYEVYMATPDKDYGQLVRENVFIYRPRFSGGFEKMGIEEVCAKFGLANQYQVVDMLGLMGDASDNIPGCQGVGEVTAAKLLKEFGSIENLLANTDKLKGALKQKVESQTEQIKFSKFLATIKTDVPIEVNTDDLETKQPDLQKLKTLFDQLEFKSLWKKYGDETSIDSASNKPITVESAQQPDLFSALDNNEVQKKSVECPKIMVREGVPNQVGKEVAIYVDESAVSQAIDLFSEPTEPVLTVWLSTENGSVYHSEVNDRIRAILSDETIVKVGYDLKNTYKRLAEHKLHLAGELFDVSVAHYLLQPEQDHSIDALTETLLGWKTTENIENKLTATLFLKPILEEKLSEVGASSLSKNIEMPLIPVLAKMELAGVRFDRKALRYASEKLTAECSEIEAEIRSLAGVDFNVNSPKQVGEILFDKLQLDAKAKKTKSGQYVTSEEALMQLSDRHPIVGKILDYRALKKLISTYLDALPDLINPQTQKIHTTYNQTVTATGRLSSSNPNLQNLPIRTERGKEIRKAVIPDKDCMFLSADYSQIELRLMAHFSQDKHLIEAFQKGQDIHAATAAKIFNCSLEEVTKDMRRKAKTANFGIIYGISAFGLAQQLGSSRAEAKELIDGYFSSFREVAQFIERAKQTAREKGYAETLLGRRRYLPDINSRNPTVRQFAERNAVNAPIQGTAADIIKQAMINIDKRIMAEGLKAQMIMQVHDELNFNVPIAEVEKLKEIVVTEMEHAIALSVPLIADCGVGQNWLEAH